MSEILSTVDKRILLSDPYYARQRMYWEEQLRNCYHPLPLHRKQRDGNEESMCSLQIDIPAQISAKVLTLCSNNELLTYTFLVTVTKCLLYRYFNQEDIVIISPINRHLENENTLNEYIHLRSSIKAGSSFKEMLLTVKESLTAAQENQDFPFTELDIQGAENLETFPLPFLSNILVQMDGLHRVAKPQQNELLVLTFSADENGLSGEIAFDQNSYQEAGLRNFANHFTNFLRFVVYQVNCSVSSVLYLSNEEEQHLLAMSNTSPQPCIPMTLVGLFEEQYLKTPNQTALIFGDQSVTYQQLNTQANAVAHGLLEKAVAPNMVVAICLPRSIEMVAAILGVMKVGAAYLPIDVQVPADRAEYMVSLASAQLVITHSSVSLPVQFNEAIHPDAFEVSVPVIATRCEPHHSAYLIFTSGTTGKPKGVLMGQQGIANAISWRSKAYKLSFRDTVLQLFNFSFDGFLTSLFTPLISGSSVVLLKEEDARSVEAILAVLKKEKVTHFICVPSLFRELMDFASDELNSVVSITLAGENVSDALISNCQNKFSAIRLFNEYGPTENAVVSSFHHIQNAEDGGIIGKPIHDTSIYVLDEQASLLPIGVTGEIYLAGNNLSQGYMNNRELTEQCFTEIVIGGLSRRAYRTGDLGFWDSEGRLHFKGRKDNQVKINGFRIELSEIESVLQKFPAVKNAVVVTKDTAAGQKIITAFIEGSEFNLEDLRSFLIRHLPYYMMPSSIHRLEKLPLTVNGKVNVQELKAFGETDDMRMAHLEPPVGKQEEDLSFILKQVLKKDAVGRHDNFFLLGGDSIKAIQIMTRAKNFGYTIGLKEIFTFPTVALLSKYLLQNGQAHSNAVHESKTYGSVEERSVFDRVYKGDVFDVYPLSPLQEGILFQTLSATDKDTYFVQSAYDVNGVLDVGLMQQTLDFLVDRHDALRTNYVYESLDRPLQVMQKNKKIVIQVHDLSSGNTEAERKKAVEQFKTSDRSIAFDLIQGQLLRLAVLKLGESRYQLVWSFHHIIMDGWCFNILSKEFFAVYDALLNERTPPLAPSIPYRRYIDWIEKQSKLSANQYWQQHLKGYEELSSIPRVSGASVSDALAYKEHYITFPRVTSDRLRILAGQYSVTLNSVMQTVWGVLLARYTNSKDVVFGSLSLGRPHEIEGVENMVGLFINTLPLRVRFTNETLFSELVRRVQNDIVAHDSQSFISLADIQRDHALKSALFDHIVIFNYLHENASEVENYDQNVASRLGLSFANLSTRERTNYGLNVTISALAEMKCKFSYDPSRYAGELIQNIGNHLAFVIEQLLDSPTLKMGNLKILPPEERVQILKELQGFSDKEKLTDTFLLRIEESVKRTPDNPAVAYNDQIVSYRELNGKANALARQLIKQGVKPNSLVPVIVNRSLELPVCLLAVLKAGAAFVPVDAYWPVNRIREVLTNVKESVALMNDPLLGQTLECDTIYVDFSVLPVENENPGIEIQLDDPIYCIFTSGSTGKPKGVLNKHLGIANRFLYMDKRYQPVSNDVVLQTSSHTFDSAVWQLLWPLTHGLKLVIPRDGQLLDLEEIISLIDRHKVTITDFVPSVFNILVQWLEQNRAQRIKLASLRQLLIGGEAMSPRHIYQFKSYLENVSITNTYGPTEASIGTIFHEVRRIYEDPIPIGKPIDNVNVLLLDADGEMVPRGVPGEICLGGVCTGLGYLNEPEKTNDVFVASREPGYDGEIFYHTGDKARLLTDGTIEFMGRIDNQLKIRGIRVELGEIESKILMHEDIREVTVVYDTTSGKPRLVAFLVCKEGFDVRALREFLLSHLPEVMIPSYVVPIDKIPLLTSGKVNKHALRERLEKSNERPTESVDGGSVLENIIAAIWKDILKIDTAGLDDHFFELGGNSLDIIRLHGKLKTEIKFTEPLVRLIQYPTIRSLARFLTHGRSGLAENGQTERRNQRKIDSKIKRKKIHQLQHDQYELHGANYGVRINNREKYRTLDVEDTIIASVLSLLNFNSHSVLIDAGCGTGDRLKALAEKVPVLEHAFSTRYGIDFSNAMIARADAHTIHGKKLYTGLYHEDLSSVGRELQGDLVLCLWCIINESLEKYPQVMANLARMVKPGGYLIFDVTTDNASTVYTEFDSLARGLNPQYDLESSDKEYLIKREDATIAYLKLFSQGEINQFAELLGMTIHSAYGYGHSEKEGVPIPVHPQGPFRISSDGYSGLVFCFHKPFNRNL